MGKNIKPDFKYCFSCCNDLELLPRIISDSGRVPDRDDLEVGKCDNCFKSNFLYPFKIVLDINYDTTTNKQNQRTASKRDQVYRNRPGLRRRKNLG